MQRPEVVSIGFDGPNRVGKGTQIGLVQEALAERGIPALVIRGDGSRPGAGETPLDPASGWWSEMNPRLHAPECDPRLWDVTSIRLARELFVVQGRFFPNKLLELGKSFGVLLVDRTVISRAQFLVERGIEPTLANLYPVHPDLARPRRVDPLSVVPSLIFDLYAPKDVLLARLDEADPKYGFRKRLIDLNYDKFAGVSNRLPDEIRDRVVPVDSSRPVDVVLADILWEIRQRHSVINSAFEPNVQ